MAGKFTNYAEKFGVDVEMFLNRAIYSTLEKGLREALDKTVHNTSRAAYHWILVPGTNSGLRPGSRRLATFDWDVRGHGPVALRRAALRGSAKAPVTQAVLIREMGQVVRRALSTSRSKVGKGTTHFALFNATPAERQETDSAGQTPYREAAKIDKAATDAMAIMQTTFANLIDRGQVRSRFK